MDIPDRTVCVFVLPDEDYNQSARESNLIAKCEQAAVVYVSQLGCLENTYRYDPDQHLMITVINELDPGETLQKVLQVP